MAADKAEGDGKLRADFPGGWPGDQQSAFTSSGRTALQNQAFDYARRLLQWRRGNEVIAKGSLKHFIPTSNSVYAYERKYGDKSVVVFLNGTSQAKKVALAQYREVLPAASASDVVTGKNVDLSGPELELQPRDVLILTFD